MKRERKVHLRDGVPGTGGWNGNVTECGRGISETVKVTGKGIAHVTCEICKTRLRTRFAKQRSNTRLPFDVFDDVRSAIMEIGKQEFLDRAASRLGFSLSITHALVFAGARPTCSQVAAIHAVAKESDRS